MPQFKLYANPLTLAPDKVMITLAEGGYTDYEYVPVDIIAREHKKPEYLARNPHGQVPVLETAEGEFIYESRAICRYLASRYNFPLLPAAGDHLALARFEQALSSEISYFEPAAEDLVYQTFVYGLLGKPADEAVIAEARKKLESYFDICEARFEKTGDKFMAGDYYSLVDVNYLPQLTRMVDRGFGDIIESRPHVKAWWERCLARPGTGEYVAKIPKFEDAVKKVEEAKAAGLTVEYR